MADTRNCEQCGAVFVPRREHARFCSVRCRLAWNRENFGDPSAEASALLWSIAAMSDTTGQLASLTVWDRPRAFALIGEAVWWVTIVDATLVRHHLEAYDGVLAALDPAERQLTEGGLAGLRFVRNRIARQMDVAEFIEPAGPDPGPGVERLTSWTWKTAPEPALTSMPGRAQAWEMTRYRAYQAELAGHRVEETFARSAAFLRLAAGNATAIPDVSIPDREQGAGPQPPAKKARTQGAGT